MKRTIKNLSKDITIVRDWVENIYVLKNVDLPTLTCLMVILNDPWIWHKKLSHNSMYVFEKHSRLDLVIGLPKLKFEKDHPCDACQFRKQTWSSFKATDNVRTSKSLQLLHMDLFAPIKMASIGGKRYAFVIFDDYSHLYRLFFYLISIKLSQILKFSVERFKTKQVIISLAFIVTMEKNLKINSVKSSATTMVFPITSPYLDLHNKVEWWSKNIVPSKTPHEPCYWIRACQTTLGKKQSA